MIFCLVKINRDDVSHACLRDKYFPHFAVRAVSRVVVAATRSLPRNGGMAEDHGAPEAGQLHRAWTRGRRGTESRQRASGKKSL